jgi:outer membrane protein OmpA-like peptidoglycan-associated protein
MLRLDRRAALVLAVALTAGCSTAGKGAAAGGVAGAVLGAGAGAAAEGNKGAAVGAVVGAAAGATAGALIGRYMDKQEKELRRDVGSARIERRGNELFVRFDSAILFDTDQAELRASAKRDLAELAGVLKKYADTDLVVEGHTDSTGPQEWNEELSWRRAQAVISFLASKGVARDRMSARGLADARPVASNDTDQGRQQNRRVEVQITASEELERKAEESARQSNAARPKQARRGAAGG